MLRNLLILVASLAATSAALADTPSVRPESTIRDSCGLPQYPRDSALHDETGDSTVRLAVSPAGEVAGAELVKSSGHARLDEATIRAMKKCRFVPAHDASGKAIASSIEIAFTWKLDTDPANFPAVDDMRRVPFGGETAVSSIDTRKDLLLKARNNTMGKDDCMSVESATVRPLPADFTLPLARETSSRELWILRQCGSRRGYVVTVRKIDGESPAIHIWAAGPVSLDDTVAPLPTVASVSDERVRAEYERAKARYATEYLVRHILVASHEAAQSALDRIHAGESFATIAAQVSTDTGSANNGGDLGWAYAHTYIGPFATTVRSLAPHGLAPAPVQTQFGWHVIEVIDTRAKPFPTFGEVKDKIAASMRKEVTDGL